MNVDIIILLLVQCLFSLVTKTVKYIIYVLCIISEEKLSYMTVSLKFALISYLVTKGSTDVNMPVLRSYCLRNGGHEIADGQMLHLP